MNKAKFNIGDKVKSVINPNFLGQVIAITQRESQYSYGVTYFKEDEPMTCTMYGFEIEKTIDNGKIGYNKGAKTE